jgi:hypothetical protein
VPQFWSPKRWSTGWPTPSCSRQSVDFVQDDLSAGPARSFQFTLTKFQQTALLLTVAWLVAVAVRFRRSTVVLVGGLVTIGLYTLVAIAYGGVTLNELGLSTTN